MERGQFHHGLWWPQRIKPSAIPHAMNHVRHVRDAIEFARKGPGSIAIQAGGNMGLWPLAMAPHFGQVHTFEPDADSFRFLVRNTQDFKQIFRYQQALGASHGECGIDHKSLGSHKVDVNGQGVDVTTVDSIFLNGQHHVALIQLDVEGFELPALMGAERTILRHKPVIQLELRGFGEQYGYSDQETEAWLEARGYVLRHLAGGSDRVYISVE